MKDIVSDEIHQEIAWFKNIHRIYPPKTERAAIGFFYSKLNDRKDSMATRVLSKSRRRRDIVRDIVKYTALSFIGFFRIFLGASLSKKKGVRLVYQDNKIVIDYQGANGQPVGVDSRWNQEETNLKIVAHSTDNSSSFSEITGNYTILDVARFFLLLFKISAEMPLIKGYRLESIVQKSRELSNVYLFDFFLIATYLKKYRGQITLLYEDQPRDRLLIYYLRFNYTIWAYVHSPAFHWYRYNLVYSDGDLLRPDGYLYKYRGKANIFNRVKVNRVNIEELNFTQNEVDTPFSSLENFTYGKIVAYLPNNAAAARELSEVFRRLSQKNMIKMELVPHPNTPKCVREGIWGVTENPELEGGIKALVVASFMTNKGFELAEQGFKVCYVGSEILPWYNPFPGSGVPFVRKPSALISYLHSINCTKV